METVSDNVNHPSHYTSHPAGIECIEITRHYCFDIGNAIKYLWRAGLKKDAGLEDKEKEIEDLKKAIWYIKDRIKHLGGDVKDIKPLDIDTFNECVKGKSSYGQFCFPLNAKGVSELNKALIETLKDKVYDRETIKMVEKE